LRRVGIEVETQPDLREADASIEKNNHK